MVIPIWLPLCIMCCFLLAAFKTFPFYFVFSNLIKIYVDMVFFVLILFGVHCLESVIFIYIYILYQIWNVFYNYGFKYFCTNMFFSSPGAPMAHQLKHLIQSPRGSDLSFSIFSPFFSLQIELFLLLYSSSPNIKQYMSFHATFRYQCCHYHHADIQQEPS